MSDIARVQEFHRSFEIKGRKNPFYQVFEKGKDVIERRMKLITEEYNELLEAVENKDFVDVADALCDLKYVINGSYDELGLDEKVDILVHKSNMSKGCHSIQESESTVAARKSNVFDPAYKLSNDGKHYIVFDKNSGKILKSIKYHPVNLNYLLYDQKLYEDPPLFVDQVIGESSKAIYSFFMALPHTYEYPRNIYDFQENRALLLCFPSWRKDIEKLGILNDKWQMLTCFWACLENLYDDFLYNYPDIEPHKSKCNEMIICIIR